MARKKSKRPPADDEDDDVKPTRREKESDAEPKTRSDAYVGLLAVSLLALIAGAVLLYVDFDELSKQTVPQPSVSVSDDGLGLPKAKS